MVIEIYKVAGTKLKEYQCLTTDLENTYPTNLECDIGSKMAVLDSITGVISIYKYFGGDKWYTA
jgi:hypothetical protein